MVWVEIWEKKYDEVYNYESRNLLNRYNEKFNKVLAFLKDNKSNITDWEIFHEWTSPRWYVDISDKVFVFDTTVKQSEEIKKILGDLDGRMVRNRIPTP